MKLPNPLTFTAAVGRVVWAFIRRKPVFVPPEVECDRLSVCLPCKFFDAEARQCTVCTCFIDLKCPVATEKCPKGFWKRYWGRRR